MVVGRETNKQTNKGRSQLEFVAAVVDVGWLRLALKFELKLKLKLGSLFTNKALLAAAVTLNSGAFGSGCFALVVVANLRSAAI